MSLSTSFRNIKITNNSIDLGFSSTGSIAANYTYDSNLTLGGDAIITNNTFMGSIGNGDATTNLMSIIDGSSIISNNNFIRGTGSPVNTYVNVTSSTDQIIKDNIFDQSTVDGTSDILVSGLSANSTYSHNKNQIIYIPISMGGGSFSTDLINANVAIDTSSSAVTTGFNYLRVFFNNVAARTFFINFNLNASLPDSVKILSVKAGIFNFRVGVGTLTSGTFTLQMQADNVVPANYSTGTGSILDAFNYSNVGVLDTVFAPDLDLFANYATLQLGALYVTADVVADAGDPNNFINTKDKCISIQVYITNDINVLGSGQSWLISPLVVKCMW